MEKSEYLVQNRIYEKLASCLDSVQLKSEEEGFDFITKTGHASCIKEGELRYDLPMRTSLTHKSDILITLSGGKYISVEIKHQSAVNDQFKARSYDFIQLKNTYHDKIKGIMIYLHLPGKGCSLEKAEKICYPFDHFLGKSTDQQKQNEFILECVRIIEIAIVELEA